MCSRRAMGFSPNSKRKHRLSMKPHQRTINRSRLRSKELRVRNRGWDGRDASASGAAIFLALAILTVGHADRLAQRLALKHESRPKLMDFRAPSMRPDASGRYRSDSSSHTDAPQIG